MTRMVPRNCLRPVRAERHVAFMFLLLASVFRMGSSARTDDDSLPFTTVTRDLPTLADIWPSELPAPDELDSHHVTTSTAKETVRTVALLLASSSVVYGLVSMAKEELEKVSLNFGAQALEERR